MDRISNKPVGTCKIACSYGFLQCSSKPDICSLIRSILVVTLVDIMVRGTGKLENVSSLSTSNGNGQIEHLSCERRQANGGLSIIIYLDTYFVGDQHALA